MLYEVRGMGHNITIYTTSICPYCRMTKEYLKSKGLEYAEVDVGEDQKKAEELVRTTGETGVPQINIDGKWVLGFDKPRLEALLK